MNSAKGYPRELRVIFVEMKSLEIVLQGLQFLHTDDIDDACIVSQLEGAEGPIQGCKTIIQSLSALLPDPTKPSSHSEDSKRRRLLSALDALAWPLKAERTIKRTLFQSNGQEFCQHNATKALFEEQTGNWVLRPHEWINWINLNTRCVWIHGIPGAGKTVLASRLIEQVRLEVLNGTHSKSPIVYYYCYHGHNQDETAPFLRWLISQICRQTENIPSKAYGSFKHNQEPSLHELLDFLHAVPAFQKNPALDNKSKGVGHGADHDDHLETNIDV
ncbi:hypothetical protein B0J13DRAFT_594736 [Dactylonectria estremocensis]|uniref:Nephrocystin 3-like N-terminal domain-containing protein n=1 Tax=Dactylonectria estremocensis TaxID=1079267 RepID=A0A9P9J576_9HYPO|nr:hypothetical protein B0J13DRAFT_594736 [Dactylonectria estremocensis]